jgi:fucose permease
VSSPSTPPAHPGRDIVWTGYATFMVVGVGIVLIPTLIRQVQAEYGLNDAAMGGAYLAYSLAWVVGTLAAGTLVRRLDRRIVLGAGPAIVALGMLAIAAGGPVAVFAAGLLLMGAGLGIADSGVNALFMDLFRGREAGALNRLHLWVSLGAMAAPLLIGQLVGAGVPWQAVVMAGALAVAPVSVLLGTRRMPRAGGTARAGGATGGAVARGLGTIPAPLLVLGVAIACYVAMEAGVTSWMVRYLDVASIELATLALSLYWGGMALARLVSSFIADRFGAVRFAASWCAVSGLAVLASLLAPGVGLAVACFALAGFAAGPVYPVIMAIGGMRYPSRTNVVASVLATAGIAGSLVYPPLMGVVSESVGLAAAMAGAGLIGLAGAAAIVIGAGMADRTRRDPAAA